MNMNIRLPKPSILELFVETVETYSSDRKLCIAVVNETQKIPPKIRFLTITAPNHLAFFTRIMHYGRFYGVLLLALYYLPSKYGVPTCHYLDYIALHRNKDTLHLQLPVSGDYKNCI
jgi:hypothetical protein